jgi:hypothetical protein
MKDKEMGTTREKGKIPHTEWPKILALYSGGTTIAEIGRRYGCTAPAIRYIIRRNGMLKGDANGKLQPVGAAAKGRPNTQHPRSTSGLATSRVADMPPFASPGGLAPADVLGPNLRRRLSGDISSFLVSLDQAIVSGSRKSLMNLVEATDVLMRVAARTRIEIARLLAAGVASEADDTFDDAAMRMPSERR